MFTAVEKNVVANCVQCGDCISSCPIFLEGPFKDEAPEDMAEKLFAVLENGSFSEKAYFTAFSCMECERCIEICPQGINPMLFLQVVKNRLVELGNNLPGGSPFVIPGSTPYIPEILQSIQMKPSEARWLREAPGSPEKKEVVVFIGCFGLATPDKNFALIDVLEHMDINFTTLLGGKLCCGLPSLFAGDLQSADSFARNLIENIQRFSPRKLILPCPTCYKVVNNVYPHFLSFDFEVEFLSTFLSNNLDRLKFTTSLNKKVTLHDPCDLARRVKDHTSPRKVIEALPGVELIEMAHNRENSLCCGGLLNITYPQYGIEFAQKLLQEAQKVNVDAMVNLCPGCHGSLCGLGVNYSYELTDLPSLINESLGGKKYENKLKAYWECRDLNKILEKSRSYFEANGFCREEMKEMISLLFNLSS